MEGEEEGAVGTQHPVHPGKDLGQKRTRDMDDGVEGNDAAQRVVCKVERQHIALAKGNMRVQSASLRHHGGREIDPTDVETAIVEVSRDVARATTQVTDRAERTSQVAKTAQDLSIERLVCELTRDALGVLTCNAVIAALHAVDPAIHY